MKLPQQYSYDVFSPSQACTILFIKALLNLKDSRLQRLATSPFPKYEILYFSLIY